MLLVVLSKLMSSLNDLKVAAVVRMRLRCRNYFSPDYGSLLIPQVAFFIKPKCMLIADFVSKSGLLSETTRGHRDQLPSAP